MSIYDEMRSVAAGVFAEFKQGTVQYVPVTVAAGARPDAPGASARGTPVSVNATARSVETKYVDGSQVLQSDKQVTIPNDGVSPEPTMSGFVRIDTVDHKIIRIMPQPAAGDPIVWKVIVRR